MDKDEIRSQMRKLAKQYVDLVNEEKASEPKRYIPASGKDISVEEVQNMVDASLDMWLTAGRFNDEFEKSFAEKISSPSNSADSAVASDKYSSKNSEPSVTSSSVNSTLSIAVFTS